MHCNCEKSQSENKTAGARCSCSESIFPGDCHLTGSKVPLQERMLNSFADQRPAGECTCSRSSAENSKPAGATCACGKRSSGMSTLCLIVLPDHSLTL